MQDGENKESSISITRNELNELIANATTASQQAQSRYQLASMTAGGYDFADSLHCVYEDFGYPAKLEFFNFWNMYRRFGIAARAVNIYPNIGWSDKPKVIGSDALERDMKILSKKFKLWDRLEGTDKRQRVGRYAGLFVRVRDGKKPSEPLDEKLNGLAALVELKPLYESQLKIVDTESNIESENFDQPTMYQYRGGATGSRTGTNASTFNIHPSRLIMAAEGADDGSVFGIPVLEPIYNSLMDLRKISGSGGEGFYKNACQTTAFELQDPKIAITDKGSKLLENFNENWDDFTRNRARRGMFTPGLKPHTLQSNLSNPKEYYMNALYDVSAGVNVAATILIGQQTGRLASSEDSKALLGNVQSRRLGFQTELVEATIDFFMASGILKLEDYEVEMDDILALSESDKLDNSVKMSTANQNQYSSGGNPVFTSEEIRIAAGKEAEPEEGDLPPPPSESLGVDDNATLED